MKKITFFLMCMTFAYLGQAQVVKGKDGIYVSLNKIAEPATNTGSKYRDSKGKVYDIFKNSKGKLFIKKISLKSGKEYRDYSPFKDLSI